MTIRSEIAPYIDALKTRKVPVPPGEVLGYLERLVDIAEKHGVADMQAAHQRVILDESASAACHAHIEEALGIVEQAAHDILDKAENLIRHPDTPGELRRDCMTIVEACGFQDYVSQQLQIVTHCLAGGTLDQPVYTGVGDFPKKEKASRDDLLLNGPSVAGQGLDQAAIDALFD